MEASWKPLFADLIFNEEGQLAKVVWIGGMAHYAVPDGSFLRHVESRYVDRQIVGSLHERITAMRDAVTEGIIGMLGQEDLFTRASIRHAIDHLDSILESDQVNVDELRTALWMAGFRATVNVHGDLVHLDLRGVDDETDM